MTTLGITQGRPAHEAVTDFWPSRADLDEVFRLKYGDPDASGWCISLMNRVGYFTPDEIYEALVAKMVRTGQAWLDVGGGRDLFPHNRALAARLAEQSGDVTGIDPDETLSENPFLHHKIKESIENYAGSRTYELVTLRMVAEHIAQPEQAVRALARLTAPGGRVVIYTINLYSPLSWASWLIPFRFHHWIKRFLWGTEEKDTFPVVYKMNTRRRLRRLFEAAGFREHRFDYLSDCRTFARFRSLFHLELFAWRSLRALGLVYPENCLLGVYERV